MKQRIVYLVMFLAAAVVVSNISLAKNSNMMAEWPIEIFEAMDNSKLIVFVKDNDIADSPTWNPANGEPPINIAALVISVNKWIAKDDRLKGMKINEIELKHINKHKNHWYYLVQLKSMSDASKKLGYVAVLLSGKVVPVMVKPASIK